MWCDEARFMYCHTSDNSGLQKAFLTQTWKPINEDKKWE